jgi:hypothetical protein
MTDNKHYAEGFKSAKSGARRVMPTSIKICSDDSRAWYAGYDAATVKGINKNLSATFNLRKPSQQLQAAIA